MLTSTCDPLDDDTAYGGHGTHVAGIIGAVANNGAGVAGMNWQTSILPVKWLNSEAEGFTSGLIAALQWLVAAKQSGVNVRVVNDSATFVGTAYSRALSEELDTLGANNILFVTAAGNTANNNDEEKVRRYPCGYDRPNEICVTASNNKDALPSWANYGPHTVDLAAPGVSVYSTLRNGAYGYLSGGSMASPQVAGAAALILSVAPSLSATALKADILENVDKLPSLAGKVITGGRLNVCRAMPGCGSSTAATVVTNDASSIAQGSATLNGSVNPNDTRISDCHFEYGTTESYGSSVPCASLPGFGDAPVAVSAGLGGLSANTTYHFRIVATNPEGSSRGADQAFTTTASPPVVLTGAASSITPTSATLNASVNPSDAAVSDCHFDYGTSASYESSIPCTALPGSGNSAVAVSATIEAITANTTYHFGSRHRPGWDAIRQRRNAHHSPQPGFGRNRWRVFCGQTSATLNATVDPQGSPVESCRFDYGASPAYGASVPCASLPAAGTGRGGFRVRRRPRCAN